jgi:hypothetical protein
LFLLFKRIDGWYGVVLLDTECLISIHTRTFRGNSKECDYRTKRERERNTRTDVAIGNRPISSSGIKRVERRKTQTYRRKPCACPLSSCSALLCSALLGAEFAHQSPLSEEAGFALCLPLLSCSPLGSSAQLLICATRNRRGGLPLPALEYSPETRD